MGINVATIFFWLYFRIRYKRNLSLNSIRLWCRSRKHFAGRLAMSNNFIYYSPTKVYFGKGVENKLPNYIKEFGGTSVLLVYGGKSAIRLGLIDLARKLLSEANIPCVELGGIVPNPRLKEVYKGIQLGKDNHVDFILAIGGGSVIDTAKAIGYGLAEPGKDVWELFDGKRKATGCMPVGCVLTISAAGSELSNSCVIRSDEENRKGSYADNLSRPKFVASNPEFTMTLPDYQTMAGCVDIMMHTMERYFTPKGNMELTDEFAEALLRRTMADAIILHQNPNDYEARAEVMWASSLSHNGLTGCGNGGDDFATHGLEKEIGGIYDTTHGAGLAAIWPSWARYVMKDCLHRFKKYALNVMNVPNVGSDEEIALAGIKAMEEFYRSINMPTNLRELGVNLTDEQVHELAVLCALHNGGKRGAAKVLYQDDMEAIYAMAR